MRTRLVILLLPFLVLAAACGGAAAEPAADSTPAPNQSANAQSAAQQPTDDAATPGPIALVNGEAISVEDFERSLRRRTREMNAVADENALEITVLTELINQVIVEQAAARMDISVTDAELDAEIAELQRIAEENDRSWDAWLSANNYTEAQLRAELRAQLIAARVRDAVVVDIASENTRQVHARHILVSTREQAATIRARLLSGEDFVALAAEYSRDVTTRNEGGDLGWFTQDELLEPVVAEAAFAQPAGTISEPVATRLGWHIIETLEYDDLPLPPNKQAQVAQGVFDEWLTTQRDSAIIEVNR